MSPVESLRALMREKKVDFYIHFNTDFHQSEYIGKQYAYIKYVSGFSGSNATIIVSQSEAVLWTDGRYFIQAENEIKNSGFKLFKQNVEGYPGVNEYLSKQLKNGSCLGLDGRLITKAKFDELNVIAEKSKSTVKSDVFFLEKAWKERPKAISTPIWVLSEKYSGKSIDKKLRQLMSLVRSKGANAIILNDLCDIAYVLNLRGNDISNVPVFYSYLFIQKNDIFLFCDKNALSNEVYIHLEKQKRKLHIYDTNNVYDFLKNQKNIKILADKSSINFAITRALKNCEMIYSDSTVSSLRSVKNKTEISNIKSAHVDDGAVLTKLIYRLKNGLLDGVSEYDISLKLKELRKEISDYLSDSFETISAYKENAAMMHYSPQKDRRVTVKKRGFLLVDTGGHYLRGSSDVTRTICVGKLTHDEKLYYTKVLKAHLRLMDIKFPKGATGENLDVIARSIFWNDAEDYLSGTGHGVGYLLSVHEGPNAIRWRYTKRPTALVPGMITTNEPGYYKEGEFGIRIENELLCVRYKKSEYGEFYGFEPITYVPYDNDAIIYEMLNQREKRILTDYNKLVYNKLKDKLTNEEKQWLKKELN